MILDKIAAATRQRVDAAKDRETTDRLKAKLAKREDPFAFERALVGGEMAFICEVKKASPSKGVIAPHFPYAQIAADYESAGAAAISVLTEPEFFMGRDEYLTEIKRRVSLPVLRKDFIIDEYQIYEANVIGADAVLLICALLEAETVRRFITLADELGMSCLVEAHDAPEVDAALRAGARVVGVNNRDLKTFQVDLNTSLRLRGQVPEDIVFVAESGVSGPEDIRRLREAGVDAVLVGESLMREPDRKRALRRLKGVADG